MKNNQDTTKPMAKAVINLLVKGQFTLAERIAAAAFVVGINEGAPADRFSALKKLSETEITNESSPIIEKIVNGAREEYFTMIPMMEDHDFGMKPISEDGTELTKRPKEGEKNDSSESHKEFEGSEDSRNNPFQKKGETRPLAKGLRAKGMTQDELADAADVDKSTISRIKLGVRKPSFDLMKKLSDVFGDVQSLFPELA